MFEVNAVELEECLTEDLKAGLTPMVSSSPGMGKSDIIRTIATKFKLKVIDFRVSQCEPVDMQGYPGVVNGRMTFHIPEYLIAVFLQNQVLLPEVFDDPYYMSKAEEK